jgi:hypothetical protein
MSVEAKLPLVGAKRPLVEDKSVEIALKSEVRRQVGLKHWEVNVGNHTQTHLVNAWKKMLVAGMEDEVSEMIWDYCLKSPDKIWIEANSELFGVYSIIGEYENKKGYKSLAHFTENKHYLGSVLELGNKPIKYKGQFCLSKERFQLNIYKLPTLKYLNGAYLLKHLFSPVECSLEKEEEMEKRCCGICSGVEDDNVYYIDKNKTIYCDDCWWKNKIN